MSSGGSAGHCRTDRGRDRMVVACFSWPTILTLFSTSSLGQIGTLDVQTKNVRIVPAPNRARGNAPSSDLRPPPRSAPPSRSAPRAARLFLGQAERSELQRSDLRQPRPGRGRRRLRPHLVPQPRGQRPLRPIGDAPPGQPDGAREDRGRPSTPRSTRPPQTQGRILLAPAPKFSPGFPDVRSREPHSKAPRPSRRSRFLSNTI
jgi:hypothetical protein